MAGGHDDPIVTHWPEIIAAILLLLGFLTALIIQSPLLNYLTIFCAGILAGRMVYQKHRTQPIFPFILIAIGFLLGFMLGAISANKIIIFILFIGGAYLSHWAHKQGYVEFFKSQGFVR